MDAMPPAPMIASTLAWRVGTISRASMGSTTREMPMALMCIGVRPSWMERETSSPGTIRGLLNLRLPSAYSNSVRWLWSLRTRKS